MSNPYKTLGLAEGASDEEVKKAYRKLAQQHHPDKGGDEDKFKEIKAAYEQIVNGGKNAGGPGQWSSGPGGMDINEMMRKVYEDMLRNNQRQARRVVLGCTMRQAYNGATIDVTFPNGVKKSVVIPQGQPEDVPFAIDDEYTVTLRYMDTNFTQLSGVDMYRTKDGKILIRTDGDVMTTAKVNAVTLMMGGWIKIKDFLDEEISVRVPAGMNPEAKMRVAGKGFAKHVMSSKHDSSSIKGRGALLISVIPTFDVKDVSIEAATSLLEKVKSENP